jgi:hypothetical protein
MSQPSGPVAYATLSLNIYDDGRASVAAYGCVMDPDGGLQALSGGASFAIEIPLAYGATADTIKAAIGQAIADGYGGSAPDVVLASSF